MGAFIATAYSLAGGGRLLGGDVNPINTYAQLLILFGTIVFGWKHRNSLRALSSGVLPYFLFVVFCATSVVWSDFPDVTLRRTITLAVGFCFGFYAAAAVEPRRFIELLARATLIAAVASLALYFALPELGRDSTIVGAPMRGVFAQKNGLGNSLLPGLACYLYFWQGKLRTLRAIAIPLAAIIACIVMADSATALSLAILLIALALFLRLLKTRGMSFVAIALLVVVVGGLVLFFITSPAAFFAAVGRDTTLTGRVQLWNITNYYISQSPLLGYGYGAFWVLGSARMQYIIGYVGWAVPNAHNGFLDMMLQVGLIGSALFASALIDLARRTLRYLPDRSHPEAAWIVLIFALTLASNFFESIPPGALITFSAGVLSTWSNCPARSGRWTGRQRRRPQLTPMELTR